MRRGTRVGQAYIALTADGSGINDDIVDSVDSAGDGVERAGEQHGERYGDSFGERFGDRIDTVVRTRVGPALSDRLGQSGDAAGEDFASRFERRLGDSGRDSGRSLSDRFDTVVRQRMDRTRVNLARSLERRLGDAGEESGRGFSERFDTVVRDRANRTIINAQRATDRWRAQVGRDRAFNAQTRPAGIGDFNAEQRRYLRERFAAAVQNESAERRLRDYRSTTARMDRDDGGALRRARGFTEDEWQRLGRMQESALRMNQDREQRIGRMREQAARMDLEFQRRQARARRDGQNSLGDRAGRLTGMGSRNNFLNIFGRTVRSSVRLTQSFGRIFTGTFKGVTKLIGSTTKAFTKGFGAAADGASFLQKVVSGFSQVGTSAFAGISKGLAGMVASAPAAAAAVLALAGASLVLIGILSALVSVASALVALLVAMSATIVSALTIGVVVLAASFVALAAAGGLVAVAFTSMTDAQKGALKASFKPLKAELTGLGQLMITKMVPYFQTWANNLKGALALLAPLAAVMGETFGRAGNILTQSLSGPGFQRFYQALGVYLPSITENMSRALGNFLNGMLGLFSALLPYVQRFSEYLVEVTSRFSDWANSVAGQNTIVGWADRALASLQSFWNFTREFFGWLTDILFSDEATGAGNTIFDSLAKSFEGFRKNLDNGNFQKWFDDALEFGATIKDLIIGVKDLWKSLDNSQVLMMVGIFFTGLGKVLTWLGERIHDIITFMTVDLPNAIVKVQGVLGDLGRIIGNVIDFFKDLFGWLTDVKGRFDDLTGVIKDPIGAFKDLGSKGKSAISGIAKGVAGLAGAGSTFKKLTGGSNEFLDSVTATARGVGGASNNMASYLKSAFGDISNGASGAANVAASAMNNVIASMANVAKAASIAAAAVRAVGSAGRAGDIAAGVVQGVQSDASAYISENLINTGQTALDNTSTDAGGTKEKPEYQNPYTAWADKMLDQNEKIQALIRKSFRQVNLAINKALRDAAKALTGGDARAALQSAIEKATSAGQALVDEANSRLDSATQTLGSASSAKATAAALKAWHRRNKELGLAIKAQYQLQKVAARLRTQRTVRKDAVDFLVSGGRTKNATLAEYAAARGRIAAKLEAANNRLADAINLRNQYATQIADSVRAFGSLMTAQAKTVDGVQQALTAVDIIDNLKDRLAKIRTFQEDLRKLLALGLSNEAYKQIADAGVEEGGAFAAALVAGGQGSIQQVNGLTAQIGSAADLLGSATSTRLYQAGVDAARGLVDGLESQAKQLDKAAARLGLAIANAIKKALGIKSPSRVMRDMMDYGVGAGIEQGLDAQHGRVDAAAGRLFERIGVSPEVARYAAAQDQGVSGKPGMVNHWEISGFSKDPETAAREMVNEMTGRLL